MRKMKQRQKQVEFLEKQKQKNDQSPLLVSAAFDRNSPSVLGEITSRTSAAIGKSLSLAVSAQPVVAQPTRISVSAQKVTEAVQNKAATSNKMSSRSTCLVPADNFGNDLMI